jgi:abortive infection alpha-like protein
MGSPEQQGIELAKEAVKQLFAPVQDLMQRLLGPAAAEVGLSFADSARIWRIKRAIRLLEEVKKMAAAAQIEVNPVTPNLIFPILDAASLADDDLQKSWAALLTNAATTNFMTEVLPSFPDILKQLTPAEVRFLDKVEYEIEHDEALRREQVKRGMTGLQGEPYVSCPLRKDTLASVSRIMLGNLQRLGLLSPYRERDFDDDGTRNIFEPANYMYLSPFGRAFVRACRPPKSLL